MGRHGGPTGYATAKFAELARELHRKGDTYKVYVWCDKKGGKLDTTWDIKSHQGHKQEGLLTAQDFAEDIAETMIQHGDITVKNTRTGEIGYVKAKKGYRLLHG